MPFISQKGVPRQKECITYDSDDDDFVPDPDYYAAIAAAKAKQTSAVKKKRSSASFRKSVAKADMSTVNKRKAISSEDEDSCSDASTSDEDYLDEFSDDGTIDLSDSNEEEICKVRKKKKGRRQRRVLQDCELEEKTKRANAEERARLKRITNAKQEKSLPSSLVFETDRNSGLPMIQVHPEIASHLKPHQIDANNFLWTTVCESVEQLNADNYQGSGCIIAHCMGLGKTLTTISFVHTLLVNRKKTNIRTCLILAPVNAQLNWIAEFNKWVPKSEFLFDDDEDAFHGNIPVYDINNIKEMAGRGARIRHWQRTGGVMVMGYTMYRLLVMASEPPDENRPTSTKKRKAGKLISQLTRDSFFEGLLNPGPDIVVFDEGHVLKSEKSALSQVMTQIKTRRRVILTGTPLQNNLMEYHCMVSFVKPGLLGNAEEFKIRFAKPIRAGEHADAVFTDVSRMKRRISVLYRIISGFVHRCGPEHLRSALPPKQEYVMLLRSTPEQTQLYLNYLTDVVDITPGQLEDQVQRLRQRLFADYHALRYVCSHPYLLFVSRRRAEEEAAKRAAKEAIQVKTAEKERDESDADLYVKSEPDDEDEGRGSSRGWLGGPPLPRLNPVLNFNKQKNQGRHLLLETDPIWYQSVVGEDCASRLEVSSKIMITMDLLRAFEANKEKTLIFSQSLLVLDLIEDLLATDEDDRQSQPKRDMPFPNWRRGMDYYRIDGSTSADDRSAMINCFNAFSNDRTRLFLISTRAGGIAVNLVAASRCIILDTSWNPAHDAQALFRLYRFGQTKPVFVYRLVSAGTMEEVIYDRQVLKQALSHRVVDRQQIARHFTSMEVELLYSFDAATNGMGPGVKTEVTDFNVPQDGIFADLLSRRGDIIKAYYDHDSLLVHQAHEDMTEEERAQAWEDYENERKKPAHKTFEPPTDNSEVDVGSTATNAQTHQPMANDSSSSDWEHGEDGCETFDNEDDFDDEEDEEYEEEVIASPPVQVIEISPSDIGDSDCVVAKTPASADLLFDVMKGQAMLHLPASELRIASDGRLRREENPNPPPKRTATAKGQSKISRRSHFKSRPSDRSEHRRHESALERSDRNDVDQPHEFDRRKSEKEVAQEPQTSRNDQSAERSQHRRHESALRRIGKDDVDHPHEFDRKKSEKEVAQEPQTSRNDQSAERSQHRRHESALTKIGRDDEHRREFDRRNVEKELARKSQTSHNPQSVDWAENRRHESMKDNKVVKHPREHDGRDKVSGEEIGKTRKLEKPSSSSSSGLLFDLMKSQEKLHLPASELRIAADGRLRKERDLSRIPPSRMAPSVSSLPQPSSRLKTKPFSSPSHSINQSKAKSFSSPSPSSNQIKTKPFSALSRSSSHIQSNQTVAAKRPPSEGWKRNRESDSSKHLKRDFVLPMPRWRDDERRDQARTSAGKELARKSVSDRPSTSSRPSEKPGNFARPRLPIGVPVAHQYRSQDNYAEARRRNQIKHGLYLPRQSSG